MRGGRGVKEMSEENKRIREWLEKFKRFVDESSQLFIEKPTKTPLRAGFDVNLINITALLGRELKQYDLRTLHRVHHTMPQSLNAFRSSPTITPIEFT